MSQENVELVRRAYEGLNRGLDATLAVIDKVVAPEIGREPARVRAAYDRRVVSLTVLGIGLALIGIGVGVSGKSEA